MSRTSRSLMGRLVTLSLYNDSFHLASVTTRSIVTSHDAFLLVRVELLHLIDSAQKPSVTTRSSGTSRDAHSCPERVVPLWDDSLHLASVTTRYAITSRDTYTKMQKNF